MHPEALIRAKRDGRSLPPDDIRDFVVRLMEGRATDAQAAAFAMAVYFRGLSSEETIALTRALIESGGTLEWSDGGAPVVDKHSTGGVGDKVSLCLAPLVASCGARVPMVSGRGLGHTGGTLDKLASIPGFRSDLELSAIRRLVDAHGFALAGQSDEMCPADRKLYALRDVTATVDSIPLITASILSKKVAEGLDALVLDVKVGSGAFMKTRADAEALAESLVRTGHGFGTRTTALLTDMDQPLGRAVGNRNELLEALAVLEGEGPDDLVELTFALGVEMLVGGGVASTEDDAWERLEAARTSGRALEALERLVRAQGGDLDAARVRPRLVRREVRADREGWIARVDAEAVGRAAMDLGAGRVRPEDAVDVEVGIEVEARRGARAQVGRALAVVEGRTGEAAEAAAERVRRAFVIADDPPPPVPLLLGRRS